MQMNTMQQRPPYGRLVKTLKPKFITVGNVLVFLGFIVMAVAGSITIFRSGAHGLIWTTLRFLLPALPVLFVANTIWGVLTTRWEFYEHGLVIHKKGKVKAFYNTEITRIETYLVPGGAETSNTWYYRIFTQTGEPYRIRKDPFDQELIDTLRTFYPQYKTLI